MFNVIWITKCRFSGLKFWDIESTGKTDEEDIVFKKIPWYKLLRDMASRNIGCCYLGDGILRFWGQNSEILWDHRWKYEEKWPIKKKSLIGRNWLLIRLNDRLSQAINRGKSNKKAIGNPWVKK